jgi:hypothetical protein
MMDLLRCCRKRRPTDWLKHLILLAIVVLTGVFAVLFIGLVWPYNDVRFGSEISTIQNPVVEQGGTLFIQNPSFCNDNQDTYIERWADLLDKEGKPIGSYEMFGIQFFNKGNGLICQEPAINALVLPNYIAGVNGEIGFFRIRQIILYHPNPVRTVYVTTTTTTFMVVSSEERINVRPD